VLHQRGRAGRIPFWRAPAVYTFTSNEIGFIYDPTQTTNEMGIVGVTSNFAAGWFMCGDTLLSSSDYTPGDATDYFYACSMNGIVGTMVFDNAQYLFAPQDAATYAVGHADVTYCRSLYTFIGETISDLPPYSCSRTVRPGFFTCMGTALANTQLLLQAMIFLAAMFLTRLAVRFPPLKNHKQAPPRPTAEVELANRHAVQGQESELGDTPYAGSGRYVGNRAMVSNPLV
jgi:hypothetical protein